MEMRTNTSYYSSTHAPVQAAHVEGGADWATQKVASDMQGLKGRLGQYFQVADAG